MKFIFLYYFLKHRYAYKKLSSQKIESLRKKNFKKLFKTISNYPYYKKFLEQYNIKTLDEFIQNFSKFPIVDKSEMNSYFHEFNVLNIDRTSAMNVALEAEKSRSFQDKIQNLTVGLSSGTSGKRGVFFVSDRERMQWSGAILGKMILTKSFKQIVSFWKPKLKIALFLRSGSNLYDSIQSSRIDFRYFDLSKNWNHLLEEMILFSPNIIVAPASVLEVLGNFISKQEEGVQQFKLNLHQIISVAEVLDKNVKSKLKSIFQKNIDEIYQCTEGFLGSTCRNGNIHIHEEFIYLEKEWLDDFRFIPILTDFSRKSQAFIRYRLNDILKVYSVSSLDEESICPCGNHSLILEKIEGREDEIIYFTEDFHLFPDQIRGIMFRSGDVVEDYMVLGEKGKIQINLKFTKESNSDERMQYVVHCRTLWKEIFDLHGQKFPEWKIMEGVDRKPMDKNIRIRTK